MFKITFAVVFQQDGLDKDWVRKELLSQKVQIVEENDDIGELIDIHGNVVPIWAYVCEGSLAQFIGIKLKWNCETINDYFLFPREPWKTESIFAG